MTLQSRTVSIKQLPETIDVKQRRILMRELESSFNAGRPCIVIDCSKLQYMDRSVLFLLLCCLEEAMKRHGDVRLATIPRQGQSLLMATNIGRLFKIFDHVADAVNSYNCVNVLTFDSPRGSVQQISADAA